ncbi:MAG TPA: glycosyltransferase family 4 protein [Terriglobia bacterium]|nr:glycosyltransferase family 4 protein [Terriglobia bacterium]
MQRSSIAVLHPQMGSGGSESVALWAIEALKGHAAVSLITGGPVDLARLNDYYGTNIDAGEISIRRAPMPLGLRRTAKFAGLRGAFFQRYVRRVAPDFDLMISAYNVCDFGAPGIQLIADFSFMETWRSQLDPSLAGHRRWWYGDSPLRRAYLGLGNLISTSDPEAWKSNLTLANSRWAAALLQEKFGVESRVLYPPVAGDGPAVPWAQRENGFVCIGRVVPEKRMDAVIRILEKVRQAGHDVHLHILGGVDDSDFGRKIKLMAGQHSNWVFLEGWVAGRKKDALITAHRFGINGRENEPFGIAPAEMVKDGCITFVPDGGGQTEIVDHPMLTFKDEAEAAQKICTVLSSVTLQESLRRHLAEQALKFSVENFTAGFRQVVFEFLAEKQSASGHDFSRAVRSRFSRAFRP